MKRTLQAMLFVLLTVGWMAAQHATTPYDILGAHNNGGRGCAACHAPHSGGRGNGGDLVGTSTAAPGGVAEGDYHLWGQDLYAITSETLLFGGGYDNGGAGYSVNFNSGAGTEWYSTSTPLIGGIASCLSCHDGNVSKGAMMMGQSYEQQAGILATIVGQGQGATTNALYGTSVPIPTLLGADGGTPNDYLNDHPVGYSADYNALSYPFSSGGLGNWGLTFAPNLSNPFAPITWTVAAGSDFANFLTHYTASAINGMAIDSTHQVPYVVCTTCHNQHQMTIYNGGSSQLTEVAGVAGGTYNTYFFVNGPYNPGAAWTPTSAPSTTQFCRQCHFGMTNEAMGNNNVTTAF
jgi:hypothetical protein